MKLTFKIWFLIFAVILSLITIFGIPPKILQHGVLITSVEKNSTAFEQGLRQDQIITSVDNIPIKSLEDFTKIVSSKFVSKEKVKLIIQTTESQVILFDNTSPDITVSELPKTNIKWGLDLVGGSRALVKAADKDLSSNELSDLIAIVRNRLNVYGIVDIKILPVSDLSGNNFMLIEIAGATPKDLKELVGQQGKFEANIGNQTVFVGGDKDISSVCRNDATCAGIYECTPDTSGSYYCNFRFSVFLSEEAAKRHANITNGLLINSTPNGNYLSERLDLYVDDSLEDSLLISDSLKGVVTTQISVSGSGNGLTQEDAYNSAEASMKKLQTILITGSLPYKLEIIKLDTISPVLGDTFIKIILLACLSSLLAVATVIFFRYKKIKSSLALIMTSVSEVLIILGIASFIEWNLDLPSIAGIIAGVGTGIDSQIIVIDESKLKNVLSLKEKLKRAFKIILGTYFTALVSLIPLLWAGAGLFKGFAITTIIGITIGVFITRPAFTDIIEKIEE